MFSNPVKAYAELMLPPLSAVMFQVFDVAPLVSPVTISVSASLPLLIRTLPVAAPPISTPLIVTIVPTFVSTFPASPLSTTSSAAEIVAPLPIVRLSPALIVTSLPLPLATIVTPLPTTMFCPDAVVSGTVSVMFPPPIRSLTVSEVAARTLTSPVELMPFKKMLLVAPPTVSESVSVTKKPPAPDEPSRFVT